MRSYINKESVPALKALGGFCLLFYETRVNWSPIVSFLSSCLRLFILVKFTRPRHSGHKLAVAIKSAILSIKVSKQFPYIEYIYLTPPCFHSAFYMSHIPYMSFVMDYQDNNFTSIVTKEDIRIKPIQGPPISRGVDKVLYTCKSLNPGSFEVARKTIRIVSDNGYTSDSDNPVNAETDELEQLDHQHCVRFVDAYKANSADQGRRIYILTSPVAETDLGAHLESVLSQCKPNEIPSLFRCLINGLNYIHGKGTVHMDVKPSNILLLRGHVYFTDFGAAVKGPKPGDRITERGVPRTRTEAYCAPEVEAGHQPQTSADIFSLGAVFLECLTICCDPGYFKRFKGAYEGGDHDDEFSWAGCHAEVLEKAGQNVDNKNSGSWSKFKSMLLLCQLMMNSIESQRPSASALSQCWTYADCLGLPKSLCSSEECRSVTTFQNVDEALQEALVAGHWLAAELLCHAGADVNTRWTVQGHASWDGTGTLLHLAASQGNTRFLTFLLDQGIEVNEVDSRGSTPLHIAVGSGDEDMINALLERNPKINAVNDRLKTPLDVANGEKRRSIISLLQREGAVRGDMVCDEDSAKACRG